MSSSKEALIGGQMNIRMLLEELRFYRDNFGLLVHSDGDGGDSANRTMAAAIYMKTIGLQYDDCGLEVSSSYLEDRNMLRGDGPGRYRRHPDPRRWYSNQDNFSRDQSIVLQSAMVIFQDRRGMLDLLKARAKRLLFHFNTQEGDDRAETVRTKLPDPPAPIEVAQFIRGLRLTLLAPLLLILDLQLLVDVLIVRPITKRQGNKDFDVQFLPILLSALSFYPTPIARLAALIYAKTTGVESELRRYFQEGPGLNGLEPLGELAVLAYLKGIRKQGE